MPAPPGTLTVTDAILDGTAVGVRCVGGTVAEIGPDVAAHAGDEVLEARGGILTPPLLNGHTHAAMTLLRGRGDDLPLMRWLKEAVWPVEARLGTDDVYWGVRLACLEMIASGTTTFWDMYWHPAAAAAAVRDAGVRAVLGAPLMDAESSPAALRQDALTALDEITGVDAHARPALSPHAIYTVSEESLRWIGELAVQRDLPVHIHLSETEREVEDCLEAHGERPAAYLDRLGLLGPHTVIAHGVWLDPTELSLIARRGSTIVTNPVANLKLGVGRIFDYPAAREAGIPVGLGTDGSASNNSMDMVSDMKVFALAQKHLARDPACVSAEEAWAIATGARAPLLGGVDAVRVGEAADFLLLNAGASQLSFGDLASGIAYGSSGAIVDTVVVAGRVLMRDRVIDGADEVLAHARERAQALGLEVRGARR